MKDVKVEFKVDDVNGIISLTNSDYFTAYRISTMDRVSKLVVSKKSPYHDVFGRYGVYLLVEDDCKNPPKFYVGKARPFKSRFVSHCSPSQSFKQSHLHWTDCIFIVGEKAKFSKWGSDEVEWFEDKLLKAINATGNYKTTNSPSGTFAGGSVDELLCEKQLADIKQIIGLLGYPKLFNDSMFSDSALMATAKINAKTKATTLKVGLQKGKCRPKSHDGKANPDEIEFTYRMKGGVVIKGRKVSGGFLVYKNSPVLKPVPCFNTHCKSERRLRDKLVAEGVISDGKLKCDYVFNTPSAAAGVMRGSSINGPKNWKAKDGRSYGEIFGS